METVINIKGGVARDVSVRFREPVNLRVLKGESVAVVGDNGSGKSLLAGMMLGRYPLCAGEIVYDFSPASDCAVYRNVKYISFRDIYGSSEADYCYQLRWNVHEHDDIPFVRDLPGVMADDISNNAMCRLLGVEPLLDKKAVMLSSGELRKLQIAMAVVENPRLLIIDNPFIGLDCESRTLLGGMFEKLLSGGLQLVFLLSSNDEIPSFVDSVVLVEDKCLTGKFGRDEYVEYLKMYKTGFRERITAEIDTRISLLHSLPLKTEIALGNEILSFNGVSVVYEQRTILKNLSWRVNKNEVWAVSGPNGSGKSTLLSLVCADNLQSYSSDISLFGRRRGTGESIWDIKKRIGYVSPEMHRAYLRNLPVMDIVASGLFDSVGLYRRATIEQMNDCRLWLKIFGIEHLAERSFMKISGGEQRLALLARAFVKNPELLILDEPMHGLDDSNRLIVKAIVEAFSSLGDKTVVFVSHYENELPSTITHRMVLEKQG